MAGYDYRRRMSNNAVEAYEMGTKPYDEWTKTEMLSEVEKVYDRDIHSFDINLLKEIPEEALRMCVLGYSSWHHTTRRYKETDFYFVDGRKLLDLTNSKIQKYVDYVNNKVL